MSLIPLSSLKSQNPDGPDGGIKQNPLEPCGVTQTIQHANDNHFELSINQARLYDVRDNILLNYPKGVNYVHDFIYFSKVDKDFSKFGLKTLSDIVDILPEIYSAYDKFMDKNFSGTIISSKLKSDAISILNAYKNLSSDAKYISIIEKIKRDIGSLENKNKSQVQAFLNEN